MSTGDGIRKVEGDKNLSIAHIKRRLSIYRSFSPDVDLIGPVSRQLTLKSEHAAKKFPENKTVILDKYLQYDRNGKASIL